MTREESAREIAPEPCECAAAKREARRDGNPPHSVTCVPCWRRDRISAALTAARAQGIEEAAKVAENFDLGTPEGHKIAAAIRALPAARARSEEAVRNDLGRLLTAAVEYREAEVEYATALIRQHGGAVFSAEGKESAAKRLREAIHYLDAAVAAARRGQ